MRQWFMVGQCTLTFSPAPASGARRFGYQVHPIRTSKRPASTAKFSLATPRRPPLVYAQPDVDRAGGGPATPVYLHVPARPTQELAAKHCQENIMRVIGRVYFVRSRIRADYAARSTIAEDVQGRGHGHGRKAMVRHGPR